MNGSDKDDWAFYQHKQGGWSWRKHGVGASDNARPFIGIVEAIADAVHSGFEPGVSSIAVTTCRRSAPR
jgi:hypothetical protein